MCNPLRDGSARLAGSLLAVALGVGGLWLVHARRPPAEPGEEAGRMAAGREEVIREPYYQILLGLSGTVAAAGGVLTARELRRRGS